MPLSPPTWVNIDTAFHIHGNRAGDLALLCCCRCIPQHHVQLRLQLHHLPGCLLAEQAGQLRCVVGILDHTAQTTGHGSKVQDALIGG